MEDEEVVKGSEIRRDGAYGLEEFKTRTTLGDAGLRNARRAGLKVRYAHNRGFILGSDWLNYLEDQSTVPPGPAEGTNPRQRKQFDGDDTEDSE